MKKRSSIRQRRICDLLKKEISSIIQNDVRDSRVGFVTVSSVDISPDLKNAKVFVNMLGTEKNKKDGLIGLKRAVSYIRTDLASRVSLRYVPRITFAYDEGLDRYERIDDILKSLPDVN